MVGGCKRDCGMCDCGIYEHNCLIWAVAAGVYTAIRAAGVYTAIRAAGVYTAIRAAGVYTAIRDC
jgi:hypothetical protein